MYANSRKSAAPVLTIREKYWLRAHLEFNPEALPFGFYNEIMSIETIDEDLSDRWGDRGITDLVSGWRERHFLPDNELEWISANDQRQLIWLINDLAKYPLPNTPPFRYFPHPETTQPENRYSRIIATIDDWPLSIEKKRAFVGDVRLLWGKSKIAGRQSRWLDRKNNDQMDWAIDYINRCDLRQQGRTRFSFPHTDNPKDKHAHILGFLDHLYSLSPEAQELFITKIRKTWSQKKYRESEKAKKQVYFSLSDEARRHLEQLEKARKQSKNRIIEDLLSQAVKSRPFE